MKYKKNVFEAALPSIIFVILFSIVILFMYIGDSLWPSIIGYLITIVLLFLLYRYWQDKHTLLLAVPINFLFSPFLAYWMLASARIIRDVGSDPEGWEIGAAFIAIFYSFPLAVLTLMISISIVRTNRQKKI